MENHIVDRMHLQLVSPESMRQFFHLIFFGRKDEILHAAFFDAEMRLLQTVAERGLVDHVDLTKVGGIGRMLREGLKVDASAVVLAHNHPSGIVHPSRSDLDCTREASEICRQLGISLIDHFIFTDVATFSFREKGIFNDWSQTPSEAGPVAGLYDSAT